MDNRPIGFFDSGLGGLTCIPHMMRECARGKDHIFWRYCKDAVWIEGG